MAHCTCKAGLGEACSHAAALMYALLAAVNVKDGQSSTQKACAWVIPGKTSQIQYEELSKISMTKKNKSKSTTLPSIPVPSEDEYTRFFQQLHECDVQEGNPNGTAILSIIAGHSDKYIPKTVQLNLPQPLTSLFSNARLQADLSSPLVESEKVFDDLQLTVKESFSVEKATREQSASKVWFEQRAGRVTASVFHEAGRTDSAISLIKRICYPRSCQVSTESVR
ncbi:uncharacterized protein LOC124880972 [Girardinichthys multiradiatus]|uniref:uncharacterized protein LOC124880972 n=1 Tax=Girardinichthys multiradiatus TaxID=208333 RepID=UPI001FABC413|nr:uncharacterized protein LOC124880972 [Girardinichthys multiradiatus]